MAQDTKDKRKGKEMKKSLISERSLRLHKDFNFGYGYIFGLSLNLSREDTRYHHCALLGEPRDTTSKYIESGIFVHLRRRLRSWMMISRKHPYATYYASSIGRMKEEEDRHLILYYHVIHPLSMFSFYFDTLMFFGVLMNMVAAPFLVMAYRRDRHALFIIFYPATFMYSLLIIGNFITGYYDIKNNRVVMKKRSIALHYIKSYFFFDLLALLPQILRNKMATYAGIDWDVERNKFVKVLAPILTLSIYIRYFWCLRVLGELRLYFGMSTYKYRTIKFMLNSIMIIVVSIYLLFVIMREIPHYLNESLIKHSEHTISILLLVSYGHPVFKESNEAILPIFFILIGFLIHLIMLVEGMEIWFKFFSIENKQTTVYNSTAAYMRYRALPMKLRKRIYLYLDFKYQGYFYKESVIRKATSPSLRREILLTVTKESIQRVELFDKCPGLVQNKIKATLVSEIFLPGDIIIKEGSTGHNMFFILAGTVVVTSPEDKKLCYLRDGAHFGEVALVINVARVANVIAVTPCELYKLDRRNFWDVMKYHPQIWKEIKMMARERIAKTSSSIEDNSVHSRTFSRTFQGAAMGIRSVDVVGDESTVSF